jgi:hypothetical protein
MCTKDQLVVGQLVLAFYVVAFKSYLVQVLLFKFVYWLEGGVLWAFAWSGKKLCTVRCLPRFKARCAEVLFARRAFLALDENIVAETAGQAAK